MHQVRHAVACRKLVMSAPRTVSLVLGSGGARGFAHIGVIQALVNNGFDIRSIAGTSMGALVGGIYAAGRLDVYTRWVTALERGDVIRLLDFAFDRKGLFKGEKIINLLRDLIGDRNIEDLPVSFTAVATDLRTHKEVWPRRGPLFDALRASISIPTIFTPFDYQDMQLVDGGFMDRSRSLRPCTIITTSLSRSVSTARRTPSLTAPIRRPRGPLASTTSASRATSRHSISAANSATPAI